MIYPVLPFTPVEIGRELVSKHWCLTKDGDPQVLDMFTRHYSCNRPQDKWKRGNLSRIVGPGERMVLIGTGGESLFVWRKELFRQDNQDGVNCAVFRNESRVLESTLLREAMELAWARWPAERLFTFVNPSKIRSTNPGYCFKIAGWTLCGQTAKGLLILETWQDPQVQP